MRIPELRRIYCPYTDSDIPESETNSEHIIPLSLGGANGLEIPVHSSFNTKVGSELDGKLANEFFWALRRTEYDARGHSGKEPFATSKKASYGEDDRCAQVRFHHKKGVSIWDVRDRKYIGEKGSIINASFDIDIDLPMRFTAKVALSAGYYVYGDLFRQHVDHCQLRDVMNIEPAKLDLTKTPSELGTGHLTLQTDDYLREAPSDPASEIRRMCSSIRGSVVFLVPGQDCFRVAVGLLGHYLAIVNVPARTDLFPSEGDCAWGHVLSIVDRRLKRFSWVDWLKQWVEATEPTTGCL